ncbi:Potassium-transporting ATPase ATP-binding subunit [Streptomyces sp. enrichment culture]|uniref:heavy metal translocating P-type ATPase n=1 Tax=Streptomyces sp. enrichment culture TaxID=1795815 RepID=UPI003F54909D
MYEHHRIPADGHVVGGEALVDQAAVTDEALPVYAREGAHVHAGTIVTSGSLTVRADFVGRDTTVGRIITRVEEAQADRAPIQTVAARLTQRFVPVSFALAAVTYAVTRDARRAMTMLLIACPCAAGLATPTAISAAGLAAPTAISAAIGNGARRGTLIKGGTHLEGIGRVTAVVYDKTGTLTFGKPLVTSVVTLSERFGAYEVLSLAASGELHARHPLAQAIVAHTEEQHLHVPLHQACEVVLGMGMRVELDGTRLLVGSPTLLRRHGIELTDAAQDWTDHLRRGGETVICVAHDADLIGLLGVSDAVRAGADTVIQQLRDLGVSRLVQLTGDAPETAQVVADALGITELHPHALPEAKLQLIALSRPRVTPSRWSATAPTTPRPSPWPTSASRWANAPRTWPWRPSTSPSPATTCVRSPRSSSSAATACASYGRTTASPSESTCSALSRAPAAPWTRYSPPCSTTPAASPSSATPPAWSTTHPTCRT